MTVEDLVAGQVDTCSPDTALVEAAERMIAQQEGSLVVMDGDRMVGILTERDVLEWVAKGKLDRKTRAAEMMTPNPDYLPPDTDVVEAAEWMMAAGYRHMPVVTRGKVLGMVSIKDVLWAISEECLRAREVER